MLCDGLFDCGTNGIFFLLCNVTLFSLTAKFFFVFILVGNATFHVKGEEGSV
jgi:hypothetical protein